MVFSKCAFMQFCASSTKPGPNPAKLFGIPLMPVTKISEFINSLIEVFLQCLNLTRLCALCQINCSLVIFSFFRTCPSSMLGVQETCMCRRQTTKQYYRKLSFWNTFYSRNLLLRSHSNGILSQRFAQAYSTVCWKSGERENDSLKTWRTFLLETSSVTPTPSHSFSLWNCLMLSDSSTHSDCQTFSKILGIGLPQHLNLQTF